MNTIPSSLIDKYIDELELSTDIIGLVLLQNGKNVVRFCKKPYDIDELRLLFSLSKSFTGIGVGIANDLGIISLDDLVVSYFPDKLPPLISENLSKLKIKHLLTMSCGIHENTYPQLYVQDDWVKAFLAQDFVHEPGTFYRYSTHATYMLSAIVERASGQSFYSFLKQYLLEPMEITNSSWEYCKQGITAGGMGLSLPLDAVARFGQMLLDKGKYKNKQIVSAAYIERATSPQISKGIPEKPSRSDSYGYQFHMDKVKECFAGDGAFGQLCYVVPQHNLVLVVASRNSKVDTIIDLLWETILSEKGSNKEQNSSAALRLQKRISDMSFSFPSCKPHPTGKTINGRYKLPENANALEYVEITQNDDMDLSVHMQYKHHNNSDFHFRFDEPVRQRTVFTKEINYHAQNYVSFACWKDNHILELTIFLTETPYVITCILTFEDDKMQFDFGITVSFTLKSFSCICEKISGDFSQQ